MALEITRKSQEAAMGTYTVEERLYKTSDGELVKEGDVNAAFLFASPGDEIPQAEAEELGLVKKRAQSASKQRAASRNKGR